jgi:hypothetical protein
LAQGVTGDSKRRNAVWMVMVMPKGGSRNRSGPQADPGSGRSERRGLKLGELPSEGFSGEVPAFVLPKIARFDWEYDDGKRFKVLAVELTEAFRERELAVWAECWRMPQAEAWSRESWRWPTVAEFCRLKTVVELEPDANASLVAQLHRFRDQIGLTPAGLRENGWAIVSDEVAEKRAEKQSPAPVRRLRAVGGE